MKQERLDIKNLELVCTESQRVFYFLYEKKADVFGCRGEHAVDVINCIRSGLPKEGVDTFLEKTKVSRSQVSHVLHISGRQLNRYGAHDRLSAEQSNFLFELTRIYTKTLDMLGDQHKAEHWLNRKNMALGDQSPLEVLDTTEGLRLVDDLLAQIEYGFYS